MSSATLVDDLRREIGRYVSGEIDLWDLDDWLNARTLNLPHGDPAFALSREVSLLIAELTSGHRTEDEVRSSLEVVQPVTAETTARPL